MSAERTARAAEAHFRVPEIRYAQVWEDADVLLEALEITPRDVCLSIASAGDNALALLTRAPQRVIAIDLNPAQLACLELRVAAIQTLDHGSTLELLGSVESDRRSSLYAECRGLLSPAARDFWDAHSAEIAAGIGGAGRFERYLALFRERILPLIHGREKIARLLASGDAAERVLFYEREWNTWRWRLLFRLFFSRAVMGRLGRDPALFRHVQGAAGERLLARTRHALTTLEPARNPYLRWILTGRHTATVLPCAWRAEHFTVLRTHLSRLEWRRQSLDEFLAAPEARTVTKWNLSDLFEYLSAEESERLLRRIAETAPRGARLVYWNMLAPRSRPQSLAEQLRPLSELAARLHAQDQAFFYSALVIEEVTRG